MVNVYTLKLEGGKFYVGKSNDPISRIKAHTRSRGSKWTSLYKPVRVIEVIENCDNFDEDKYTIKYMKIYGIDNVRGGSFCKLELTEQDTQTINKMICCSGNKCFRCGRSGHFITNCYASTHIDGYSLIESESESDSESDDELVCFRCGRYGHFVSKCYARRHVDGSRL